MTMNEQTHPHDACAAEQPVTESPKSRKPHWVKSVLLFLFHLACLFGVACLFFSLGDVLFYSFKVRFSVLLFSTLATMCVFWALFRKYSLILWIPCMTFGCGQVIMYWQYGAFINHSLMLAEIMEGTHDEIMAYITPFNIAAVGVLFIFSCGLGWVLARCMRPFKRSHLMILGVIFCAIVGQKYISVSDKARTIRSLWPLNEPWLFHVNIKEAREYNEWLNSDVQSLPSPALKPSSLKTIGADSEVVVVLHVGESVRADRLSLNGYLNQGRSTTPWLDTQKGSTLINYGNCISSHFSTVNAVLTILTDARRAYLSDAFAMMEGKSAEQHEHGAKSGSVLDLFAANHFGVYALQGKKAGQELRHDKIMLMLTRRVREKYHAMHSPLENIPQLKALLDAHPRENLFLYVSNEGSHVPFDGYESAYAPFQPEHKRFSNPAVNAEGINNAYDNTIYYLDEYIRQVVEQLKGRPFVYIYVGDHGEYLGHDGMWGRGGSADCYHNTSGCHVPLFVIASPEFESLHPHFAEAVKNLRAHADMTVGHEHIYHTLLGIVGIETPYYNAALDLSSANPEPYTGPQPEKK